MNILVTGGSGFIGRHVCKNLVQKGHKVMVFDRIKPAFDDVIFCSGCVQDQIKLYSVIDACDGVIHLAGVLGTAETVTDPGLPVNVNIKGSLDVFEACRKFEKRCVYIAVGNHFMNNSYSITKTCAERFALMYNAEFGTEIAVVRGLNVYGPYQKAKPVRKVIPNFIIPALKNEPIIVYGSGKQIMDFIYVEDAAEILVRALLFKIFNFQNVFEAGSGNRTTINNIAFSIKNLSRSDSLIINEPMRAGEIKDSIVVADTKTLKPLQFYSEEMVSLEKGLNLTIDYYKEHLKDY